MGILDIFLRPNIEKMILNKDIKGLIKTLRHNQKIIREKAAKALNNLIDDSTIVLLIKAFCGSTEIDDKSFIINHKNDKQMIINTMNTLKIITHPEIKRLLSRVSWNFRKCIQCGNVQFDGEYARKYNSQRLAEVKAMGYTSYVNLGTVAEKCLICNAPIVSWDPMNPETNEELRAKYEEQEKTKREWHNFNSDNY